MANDDPLINAVEHLSRVAQGFPTGGNKNISSINKSNKIKKNKKSGNKGK